MPLFKKEEFSFDYTYVPIGDRKIDILTYSSSTTMHTIVYLPPPKKQISSHFILLCWFLRVGCVILPSTTALNRQYGIFEKIMGPILTHIKEKGYD